MRYAGAVAALATMMSPAMAHAQQAGPYLGAGYTNYSLGDFENIGALTARAGYRFNSYLSVEGEYSFGVIDGDNGGLDAELDSAVGAFVVGFLPITDRIELFARVGYGEAEVSATGSCGMGCVVTASTDDEGMAYGGGAQYQITERFGIRGEYTHGEGDFNDADAFGISGVFNF